MGAREGFDDAAGVASGGWDGGGDRGVARGGFGILILVVAPHRYSLGSSGTFAIGTGVTAYTLGLRHAFDADHISAIDNTTRKFMSEGKRPLSVGFFFSLGHSTIVFALAFLIAVGVKALADPVRNTGSLLHKTTNISARRCRERSST